MKLILYNALGMLLAVILAAVTWFGLNFYHDVRAEQELQRAVIQLLQYNLQQGRLVGVPPTAAPSPVPAK